MVTRGSILRGLVLDIKGINACLENSHSRVLSIDCWQLISEIRGSGSEVVVAWPEFAKVSNSGNAFVQAVPTDLRGAAFMTGVLGDDNH